MFGENSKSDSKAGTVRNIKRTNSVDSTFSTFSTLSETESNVAANEAAEKVVTDAIKKITFAEIKQLAVKIIEELLQILNTKEQKIQELQTELNPCLEIEKKMNQEIKNFRKEKALQEIHKMVEMKKDNRVILYKLDEIYFLYNNSAHPVDLIKEKIEREEGDEENKRKKIKYIEELKKKTKNLNDTYINPYFSSDKARLKQYNNFLEEISDESTKIKSNPEYLENSSKIEELQKKIKDLQSKKFQIEFQDKTSIKKVDGREIKEVVLGSDRKPVKEFYTFNGFSASGLRAEKNATMSFFSEFSYFPAELPDGFGDKLKFVFSDEQIAKFSEESKSKLEKNWLKGQDALDFLQNWMTTENLDGTDIKSFAFLNDLLIICRAVCDYENDATFAQILDIISAKTGKSYDQKSYLTLANVAKDLAESFFGKDAVDRFAREQFRSCARYVAERNGWEKTDLELEDKSQTKAIYQKFGEMILSLLKKYEDAGISANYEELNGKFMLSENQTKDFIKELIGKVEITKITKEKENILENIYKENFEPMNNLLEQISGQKTNVYKDSSNYTTHFQTIFNAFLNLLPDLAA